MQSDLIKIMDENHLHWQPRDVIKIYNQKQHKKSIHLFALVTAPSV